MTISGTNARRLGRNVPSMMYERNITISSLFHFSRENYKSTDPRNYWFHTAMNDPFCLTK